MIHQGTVYRSVRLAQVKEVAKEIAGRTGEIRVWLFEGDLGAGKTTLIKAVCETLGVTDTMSSPTFAIVNEYKTNQNGKIFHFDFYRIRSEAEAYEIGADEYFYSGYPCFIEWPDRIPSLIPPQHAVVSILMENESERTIGISVHDGKEENRI